MKELLRDLTGGQVTEAKVILSSVVVVLAAYQVFLMLVGYGKIRLSFLGPGPATRVHRAVGDTLLVLAAVLAFMCVVNFGGYRGVSKVAGGTEKVRVLVHVVTGTLLLAVLFTKVAVVRLWRQLDRFLPLLGGTIFACFLVIWVTSALDYMTRKM
jgi:hypothetical protein